LIQSISIAYILIEIFINYRFFNISYDIVLKFKTAQISIVNIKLPFFSI